MDNTPPGLHAFHDQWVSRFQCELDAAVWPRPAAVLRELGISKHKLAGPHWVRTSPGFYRPSSGTDQTTTQRIVDAAASLPDVGVVAGWAAGFVLGADRFDGLDDHSMAELAVPVLQADGRHRRSCAGIRYVQSERSFPLQFTNSILVTTPEATARDLARWAPDVVEAVAAVDTMLQAQLIDPDWLRATEPARGPGARQVNAAFDLARVGVLSSWESRLRMFWTLTLGFPMPLVNQPVFDRNGTFLGVPDLLDEESGVAMEYDGGRWLSAVQAGHRDPDQHRRDNHREERLERAALIVVRVDKVDMRRGRSLLATRLRSARADGLRRDRTRDRWTLQPPPGWVALPA